MSESREHKRRDHLRLEFIAEVSKWLNREPPMILFWRWHKWKKERPVWETFSKREFEFYDPYDRY